MNRAVPYRTLLVTAFAFLLLATVCPRAFAGGQGLAVEGNDHVRLRLDAAAVAVVADYANAGYRLTLAAAAAGDGTREATVEVDLAPLASRAPYVAPEATDEAGQGDVEKLARALTADRKSTYGAVSAVLGWMVHNLVDETLTPPAPGSAPAAAGEAAKRDRQTPETVRARGAGDARGIARLAVAMLAAAGIEARVIEGRVLGTPEIGAPHGEHSWIEVRYPDVGWAFSDPLHLHHYVPATYLPMPPAAVAVAAGKGAPGAGAVAPEPRVELLERRDRRQTVDLYPPGAPGLTARKNRPQQVAAALRVVVAGATRGSAVLLGPEGTEAGGARVSKMLVGGESVFVGLAGGTYKLEVFLEGRPPLVRDLVLEPRQRSAVFLREHDDAGETTASQRGARTPPRVRPRRGVPESR